jgi:multidrug resistance efflux pump
VRARTVFGLLLGAAALAAALGVAAGAGRDPDRSGRFLTVKPHPMTVELVEFGEVESREVRSILAPISSEVTWVPDEGMVVKAGEPVLTMSTEALETALEEDRKAGVGLEGELATAKATAAAIEKNRTAVARRVRVELELAKTWLAEAKSHPTPEEKRLAELDLASARLRVARAAGEEQSLSALAGAGYVSDSRAKAARLEHVRAKADLVRAEAAAREILAGVAPQRLRALEVGVKKAEMVLAQALFAAESDTAMARESLAVIQTRWQIQSEKLKTTEKDIANAKVSSPVAGAVALVDVFKGGTTMSPVQVGESHPQGRELMKIADVSAPRVRLHVNEADIVRIAVGQPAEVRLRSEPNRALRARVAEIAVYAEDKNRKLGSLALEKSGEAGVNVVDVLLDLEIPPGAEQPRLGSSAEAEITVASFENALTVPLAAVRWAAAASGRPGGAVLRVLRGGRVESVPVKLGATTEDEAVVVEGLAEGDQVLVGDKP